MVEPRLYERYDRREAIALFGPATEGRSLCDGRWLVLTDVVLGFAEVGGPPRLSHFVKGSSFCWVADKPYRVNDGHVEFVPREVVGTPAERRPIHLFVREDDAGRYLYVGEVGPSHRFTLGGPDNHGEAYFDLLDALPSEVWAELGGLETGDLDHVAIDAALACLSLPVNVEGRLWVLRQLVGYWHGENRPADGFPEAELEGRTFPYPLRWWYGWAGRRSKIMSGQNTLLDPGDVLFRDGLLVFYGENQWCYEWATLPEGDDPPVFGRENSSDPWEPEGMTLSEHLILACLFEAIICHSPYGASTAWLDVDILGRISGQIPPIPINPWRWSGPTRFHAKGGAFMYAMGEFTSDGRRVYSVGIGAKTEHPLRFLKPYIDKDWAYVAV